MKRALFPKDIAVVVLLAVSLALFISALGSPWHPDDVTTAAARVSRTIGARLSLLESYGAPSANTSSLPEDMVIYRYREDTLYEWVHRLPVSRDDIRENVLLPRLSGFNSPTKAPLCEIGDEFDYINLGPKWYLAKCVRNENEKVILALEIVNSLDESSRSGVNPVLRLNDGFSVKPIAENGGAAVEVAGRPVFKILSDSLAARPKARGLFVWLGLASFLAASILFLLTKRTRRRFVVVSIAFLLLYALIWVWGRTAWLDMKIFSPLLYADGAFFYSLGVVVLVCVAVFLEVLCLYIVRKDLPALPESGSASVLCLFFGIVSLAAILLGAFLLLRSVILNSGISLELYKYNELTVFSALVFASFILLLASVPFILQLLRPVCFRLFGINFNVFSLPWRVAFASIVAFGLVLCSAVLSVDKERSILELWANRLSVDRDISLELQLRRVEPQIAGDPIIASLSVLDNAAASIRGRLGEGALARLTQNYDISVDVGGPDYSKLRDGERISENSRFVYVASDKGRGFYVGHFFYAVKGYGTSNVSVRIEQRSDFKSRGYASILGRTPPGRVSIPEMYSYARYKNGRQVASRGTFSYPVIQNESNFTKGQFRHFVYPIDDSETVVISRPLIAGVPYVVSVLFLALLVFFLISVAHILNPSGKSRIKGYFASRISVLIMSSLFVTLVAMAAVSVIFVSSRNDSNLQTAMTEKITSIQTMLSSRLRLETGSDDLQNSTVLTLLDEVAAGTGSDIALYGADGKAIMSTSPYLFERMYSGPRMDAEAFRAIVKESSKHFIHREKVLSKSFYSMYAPLFGSDGEVSAVICSPYTEENYDFERDAVTHAVTMLTLFILLLLLARLLVSKFMYGIFRPLTDMGRKMQNASVGELEYVKYSGRDEITPLVNAYNGMVSELSESTKKLAQAERDKAWSGMARQVAHEIKNPLTPMKLQLQRIIRLKDKGDPTWQEKFDEMSRLILDHIDMLTQTANEFSTFAKLYTEEPTHIDLDKLLQEEIAMFDNKGDLSFDYIGFGGAEVMGPKPQLTRVFVNIINNAVQAVSGQDGGRVVVMLRKSIRDGYYDIVFEDNGPGVSEENIQKLFTPNFTTKNGGSGLGLAISRSVLEKCGATIEYSRSFTLGGACFTITYPIGDLS